MPGPREPPHPAMAPRTHTNVWPQGTPTPSHGSKNPHQCLTPGNPRDGSKNPHQHLAPGNPHQTPALKTHAKLWVQNPCKALVTHKTWIPPLNIQTSELNIPNSAKSMQNIPFPGVAGGGKREAAISEEIINIEGRIVLEYKIKEVYPCKEMQKPVSFYKRKDEGCCIRTQGATKEGWNCLDVTRN